MSREHYLGGACHRYLTVAHHVPGTRPTLYCPGEPPDLELASGEVFDVDLDDWRAMTEAELYALVEDWCDDLVELLIETGRREP